MWKIAGTRSGLTLTMVRDSMKSHIDSTLCLFTSVFVNRSRNPILDRLRFFLLNAFRLPHGTMRAPISISACYMATVCTLYLFFSRRWIYCKDNADLEKFHDKSKGRRLLYPNTFSEECLIFMPPVACVLLVLFSRNHNICRVLLLFDTFRLWFVCSVRSGEDLENQQGSWQDPPPKDLAIQDEEIEVFQTTRLIKFVVDYLLMHVN